MTLDIDQKKGSSEILDGRVTAYAVIDLEVAELLTMQHPIASMIHNGLLVAQGNYRDQNSLADFLKSEMGLSLEEGLEEIIGRLDGIEGALDPDKLRGKLDSMKELGDFIPTPAKIVPFHSMSDIFTQEGDIFCLGTFTSIANANLSVNSFPIFYQARFREQQLHHVKGEIEHLISQIEHGTFTGKESIINPEVNLADKLLKENIPNMLYSRHDQNLLHAAIEQFRLFMREYQFPEDVEAIISVISLPGELSAKHLHLIELYAQKIAKVHNENYSEVEVLKAEIESARVDAGLAA